MEDDHILKVQGLSISFNADNGTHKVVDDISFSLPSGKTLGIVGESGSGKTMTCLSLLNLVKFYGGNIDNGRVLFRQGESAETDILSLTEQQLSGYRGKRISMIFQEPASSLDPNIRCGSQIGESLLVHNICLKEDAKTRSIKLLEEVGLEDCERIYQSFPHQLSGGQLQRVMIAIAISCDPDILIADEPTTSLDVTVQAEILELIKNIKERIGLSCIFISHDLAVIREVADDVLVLQRGKVVEQGNVKEVFTKPKHDYTRGLLACRPPLRHRLSRLPVLDDFVNNGGHAGADITLVKQAEYIERLNDLQSKEVLLDVENLSKTFSGHRSFFNRSKAIEAIKSFNLKIKRGEVHGLVGESGCGKSTLARCIALLETWNSGTVVYDQKDITKLDFKSKSEFRQKVQLIFQDPFSSLNPRMRVGDAIVEPLRYSKKNVKKGDLKDFVVALFEKVGLTSDQYERYPHQFSGGEKQRVSIARALAVEPEFIICDEPVSALDVSVQAKVLNLLSELKHELGLTLLFISHDLAVVKHMCDYVSVMSEGVLVEEGDAEAIFNDPRENYTRKLISAIPSYDFDS